MSSRTKSRIKTNIKTAMQQLDHLSVDIVSNVSKYVLVTSLTLVPPDDGADLLHAGLQLSTDSIGHGINVLQHLALLF